MLFENTGSGHKAHLRSEIVPVAMNGVRSNESITEPRARFHTDTGALRQPLHVLAAAFGMWGDTRIAFTDPLLDTAYVIKVATACLKV